MTKGSGYIGKFGKYQVFSGISALLQDIPPNSLIMQVDGAGNGYVSHYVNGRLRGIDTSAAAKVAITMATIYTLQREFPAAFQAYCQKEEEAMQDIEVTQTSFSQAARGM